MEFLCCCGIKKSPRGSFIKKTFDFPLKQMDCLNSNGEFKNPTDSISFDNFVTSKQQKENYNKNEEKNFIKEKKIKLGNEEYEIKDEKFGGKFNEINFDEIDVFSKFEILFKRKIKLLILNLIQRKSSNGKKFDKTKIQKKYSCNTKIENSVKYF